MTTKHAQDLKTNDVFYHNQLKPWKVIEMPNLPPVSDGNFPDTVKVKAIHTVSKRHKIFEFGRYVKLDISDN